MGYTSYWNTRKVKGNITPEQIENVLKETRIFKRKKPLYSTSAGQDDRTHLLYLRGGDGTGNPEFTNTHICFNGNGKEDMDHETFYFGFNEKSDFEFCKTARKPYDFAVCFCLLSLCNNIPGFEFSSDGDKEDWQPVIDFYKKNVGEFNEQTMKIINNL